MSTELDHTSHALSVRRDPVAVRVFARVGFGALMFCAGIWAGLAIGG